jgi:hypothetical protein
VDAGVAAEDVPVISVVAVALEAVAGRQASGIERRRDERRSPRLLPADSLDQGMTPPLLPRTDLRKRPTAGRGRDGLVKAR